MRVIRMSDLDLTAKRVFIRADLNVPLQDGKVSSDARITASLPTIEYALKAGAKVMVTSHLGRPEEGIYSEENSLKPVADVLSQKLNRPVRLIKDWVKGDFEVADGELVLLENCRFNLGEKKNVDDTAQAYAKLCDVFVMDAFGTAHRAEASTYGVAKFAPQASAGILLVQELEALTKALDKPARPMVAIVGGSKVSTKLTVLESLSEKVDQLVVGGGIANTFLLAQGHPIGKSLAEPDLVDEAKAIIQMMSERGAAVPIPVDVVVADVRIFNYMNKRMQADFNEQAQPVTFHDIFIKLPYRVLFRQPALRDAFNQGLKQIQQNGDYQRILKRYS